MPNPPHATYDLADLAARIGGHLGGFTPAPVPDGHGIYLEHPDGRRLHLHVPWDAGDRVAVVGILPHPGRAGRTARVECRVTRGAHAIAGAVGARLMPGYVRALTDADKARRHLALVPATA